MTIKPTLSVKNGTIFGVDSLCAADVEGIKTLKAAGEFLQTKKLHNEAMAVIAFNIDNGQNLPLCLISRAAGGTKQKLADLLKTILKKYDYISPSVISCDAGGAQGSLGRNNDQGLPTVILDPYHLIKSIKNMLFNHHKTFANTIITARIASTLSLLEEIDLSSTAAQGVDKQNVGNALKFFALSNSTLASEKRLCLVPFIPDLYTRQGNKITPSITMQFIAATKSFLVVKNNDSANLVLASRSVNYTSRNIPATIFDNKDESKTISWIQGNIKNDALMVMITEKDKCSFWKLNLSTRAKLIPEYLFSKSQRYENFLVVGPNHLVLRTKSCLDIVDIQGNEKKKIRTATLQIGILSDETFFCYTSSDVFTISLNHMETVQQLQMDVPVETKCLLSTSIAIDSKHAIWMLDNGFWIHKENLDSACLCHCTIGESSYIATSNTIYLLTPTKPFFDFLGLVQRVLIDPLFKSDSSPELLAEEKHLIDVIDHPVTKKNVESYLKNVRLFPRKNIHTLYYTRYSAGNTKRLLHFMLL